jgi:hypothetical protein
MSHHVDVVRKRCREPGCERWPSFASAGATPLFCRAHKSAGDVDVRHKRCSAAGCSREPLYSDVLGTTPRWCSHHKLPGHVNVKHRLAQRGGAAAGAGAGWGAEWLDPAGRKGGGGAGAEAAALPPAVPGDPAAEILAQVLSVNTFGERRALGDAGGTAAQRARVRRDARGAGETPDGGVARGDRERIGV